MWLYINNFAGPAGSPKEGQAVWKSGMHPGRVVCSPEEGYAIRKRACSPEEDMQSGRVVCHPEEKQASRKREDELIALRERKTGL